MKLFTFACVALLVLGANASPVQPEDLTDDVQAALETLRNIIDSGINSTISFIDGAMDDLEKDSKKVLDNTKKQMDNILMPVKKNIEKEELKAIQEGKDISGCLKFKDDLDNIPDKVVQNNKECIEKVNSDIKTRIDIMAEQVRGMTSVVDDLQKQLDDCSVTNPLCLAKLDAIIAKDIISIPKEMMDIQKQIMKIMKDASTTQAQCSVDNIKSGMDSITALSQGVLDCYLHAPKLGGD